MQQLRARLSAIDGRSYRAYKDLRDAYVFPDFELSIDHVQGDPYARASRLSVRVTRARAGIPAQLLTGEARRLGLADYLGRALAHAIAQVVKGHRGTGRSGQIAIEAGGQEVLARNAVVLAEDYLEARLTLGLPAAGRRVLADQASAMFFDELPELVRRGLLYENLDRPGLERHVLCVEDQAELRAWLAPNDLVAFVADGARLPRRSGVDERPFGGLTIPFESPPELAREVSLPHAGRVRGMGLPTGVTLIVGGGFHGKSTLLRALERAVYPHIPDDGREHVATIASAVKVRAEDGRSIAKVDISPFIDHLPLGQDTRELTTPNASGSTSQAAAIVEAVASGTRLLLIDEDTSATNFMIRDRRMQALVSAEKEPITPYLHRVRELYERHGISSVIVMGGSGDYFEVADRVLMLDSYRTSEVTARARALAGHGVPSLAPAGRLGGDPTRRPSTEGLAADTRGRPLKVEAREARRLRYDRDEIDLAALEQLVDRAQTRAIGWLIHYYATRYSDGLGMVQGLRHALRDVEARGLDILCPYKTGELAVPRLHEVAATLNRMRGLRWET